jgi:hypothetical protein
MGADAMHRYANAPVRGSTPTPRFLHLINFKSAVTS